MVKFQLWREVMKFITEKLNRKIAFYLFIVISFLLTISGLISSYNAYNEIIKNEKISQSLALKVADHQIQQFYFDSDIRLREQLQIFKNLFSSNWKYDNLKSVKINGIESPYIENGGKVIDNSFVDEFHNFFQSTVTTIFVKKGNDFLRISSTLKKQDGTPAIGTMLGENHPAYVSLLRGNNYEGMAELFGKSYFTKYHPVLDKDGLVIAVLFIGLDLTSYLDELNRDLNNIKVGETGYIYISGKKGELITHPTLRGKNIPELGQKNEGMNLLNLLEKSKDLDLFEYDWTSSGVTSSKIGMVKHFKETGWYIVSSANKSDIHHVVYRMMTHTTLFNALLIIAIITFVVLVVRKQLRPLEKIQEFLQNMSNGDLSQKKLTIKSKDEIGQLALSINSLQEELSKIVSQVVTQAKNLNQSSEIITTSCRSLNEGTFTQITSLTNIASSTEEMSVSIDEVAQSSKDTFKIAQDTQSATLKGERSLEESISSINNLIQGVKLSNQIIETVSQSAKDIESVISVIKTIADQTNLLALNAAIEAARAGESGRGFAVVADEVRVLSQKTAVSTAEIQNVILEMQSKVNATSQQSQQLVSTAVDCGEKVNVVSTLLQDVTQKVIKTEEGTMQVSTATQQQSIAVSEITQNVQSVKLVSEQIGNFANDLDQQSVELKTSADKLQESVSFFKVWYYIKKPLLGAFLLFTHSIYYFISNLIYRWDNFVKFFSKRYKIFFY